MTVWVICQNDFPVAVMDSHVAVMVFIDQQPVRDINGKLIHWRWYQFVINNKVGQ